MYIITGGLSNPPQDPTVQLGRIPHKSALGTLPMFSTSGGWVTTANTAVTTVTSVTTVSPSTPLVSLIQPTGGSSTEAIAVGPSSPPIPIKMAQKIWRNEFIELHDLLPARLGIPEPTLLDVLTKPDSVKPRKEISTIQQWALCFNTYMAVLTRRQPERIRDLLAYSSIIIKASEEYDDAPWLQYDMRFRRLAATEPSRSWAVIDACCGQRALHQRRPSPEARRADG